MFETPPPKTITLGSKISITFARLVPKFSRNSSFHCFAFSSERSCTIDFNGSLHRGRTNIAGEWGHHTLHPNGNKCYCGKQGCVETYICGPALENRWLQITGKKESLQSITQNLSDEKAEQWKTEFLQNFGIALANVIDILDPDAIVLGGGVSNIPFLYDEGRSAVYEKVFSDLVETPILKNGLGDSAGVFGACLL